MGWTDAARSAGGAEAPTARRRTHTAASAITIGSNGLTLKSIERRRPDAAAAPASPITQPMAASFAPETRTSFTIVERWEPRVMRMAISCTREATEKAMTE